MKNNYKRRVYNILKLKSIFKTVTKETPKVLKIMILGFILIIAMLGIKYKPVYKVTDVEKELGYIEIIATDSDADTEAYTDENTESDNSGYEELYDFYINNSGYIDVDYFVETDSSDYISTLEYDPDTVSLRREAGIPSSYDSRDFGMVTEAKNQGAYGTCWAFAVMSAAESSLISQNIMDKPDLSELHFAYFMYHCTDDPLGNIGNDSNTIMSSNSNFLNIGGADIYNMFALAAWRGAANESEYPYEDASVNMSIDSSEAYNDVVHLQNVDIMSMTNKEAVKRHIMEHGSVTSSIYLMNNYNYNSIKHSYYQNSTTKANHEISIIGWDDDYSADNFNSTVKPSADGAWLIKNSWGLENGDCGYYWVSYEEPTIDSLFYFDTQSSQLHDNLYAHDDFGGSGALSVSPDGDEVVYFSNVYCAEEDGYVTDVMIDCMFPSDCYEITIYTNLSNNSNPASGKAHRAASGVMDHTGYQIIKLNKPVQINCGEFFSVAAKVSGEKGFHATCELANNHPESPVPSGSTAYSSYPYYGDTSPFINTKKNIMMSFGENQSFISEDGKKWTDIYNLYSEENNQIIGNVCLKALSVKKGAVHFSSYSSSLPVGSEILLSCADSSDIYSKRQKILKNKQI